MEGLLYGLPLIASDKMVIRTQKRKHRKYRINKKWLKRYGYTEVPDLNIYLFKDPYTRNSQHIAGHPITLARLMDTVGLLSL